MLLIKCEGTHMHAFRYTPCNACHHMCSPQGEILPIASEFIIRTLDYKWELPIWLRITLAALALSGKTRNPNGSRSRDLIAPTGKG